jgi:hypothetical protein
VDRNNKWEGKYAGVYRVLHKQSSGHYTLQDVAGHVLKRDIPADQIKLVSTKKRKKDDHVYIINKILAHRTNDAGALEYYVDWKGFDESHRSWEPIDSFIDTTAVTDYMKQINLPAPQINPKNRRISKKLPAVSTTVAKTPSRPPSTRTKRVVSRLQE